MTPYEVNSAGEASQVHPQISPEQIQINKMILDSDDSEDGWDAALDDLKPYVQHIGNCGAVGSDPEDSRCICGLRQIWMGR